MIGVPISGLLLGLDGVMGLKGWQRLGPLPDSSLIATLLGTM